VKFSWREQKQISKQFLEMSACQSIEHKP